MKKQHPVYILFLASAISMGLGQGLASASQQAAAAAASVQAVKEQHQLRQHQSNAAQTSSGAATNPAYDETPNFLSSTTTSSVFGGDACRPEKIEVTPCK